MKGPIDPELDALVRRADEDRWLASRFAPAPQRHRLIALYAVNVEIARIAETAREPRLGEIRLAWWREALEEILAGAAPRPHPALAALAAAHAEAPLPPAEFAAMLDARRCDFETHPFADDAAVRAYVDATAGATMRLALTACGVARADALACAGEAAWRWGMTGLMRSEAYWGARGRRLLPDDPLRERWLAEERAGRAAFRRHGAALPPAAFPALGYVALTPLYLRGGRTAAHAPLLVRQLHLVAAAATGRLA